MEGQGREIKESGVPGLILSFEEERGEGTQGGGGLGEGESGGGNREKVRESHPQKGNWGNTIVTANPQPERGEKKRTKTKTTSF